MGMARKLRFVPDGGALVEVTCRTLHGRLLLRPSLELNGIIGGILGRAQRLYPVRLINHVWASNHYHLVLWVENARRLAQFVGYLNSNLAREVSRLTGWSGKIWERRYQAILISEEEAAQVERFAYVLSHGVKENLVARLEEWPGVHAVRQLLGDEPLTGYWFDRTQEYLARRNRKEPKEHDPLQFATLETVELSRLPCWEHLSPEAYRERVAGMVKTIEEDAAAARKRAGTEPFGREAILAQHPHTRPEKIKKSPAPAPFVHAATKATRQFFYGIYAEFVAAYRTAAEKLRAGDPKPGFPVGCFPPALPFVSG
jgi:hypothetical protein